MTSVKWSRRLWLVAEFLFSRKIQTKNRSVCENAVTGMWGSFTLQVIGSWLGELTRNVTKRLGYQSGQYWRHFRNGGSNHNAKLFAVERELFSFFKAKRRYTEEFNFKTKLNHSCCLDLISNCKKHSYQTNSLSLPKFVPNEWTFGQRLLGSFRGQDLNKHNLNKRFSFNMY